MKSKILLFLSILFFSSSVPALASSVPVSPSVNPAYSQKALETIIMKLSPRQFEKLTGKKLRFKDRIAYRIMQWKLRHQQHEAINERQRKQGKLSLIFGIGSLVLLFIPPLGIVALCSAAVALVLGILSLKGNSNTAGIIGLVIGATVLVLFVIALAAFTASWY